MGVAMKGRKAVFEDRNLPISGRDLGRVCRIRRRREGIVLWWR
jgi:hypothetical protein